MNKLLYIFLLLIIIATGCRKDVELENTEIIILEGEDVETNLHGRIITPSGNSVTEAEVTVGDFKTYSNSDGYFYFLDLSVPEDGFAMEVNSRPYTKTIRRIIPQANNNTYEEVTLISVPFNDLSEAGIQSIHSDSLELVSLSIPANSLVDENNRLHDGFYQCKIYHYDPSNTLTLRTMPGNLEGINQDGEKVTLGTLGMIHIDVQSEDGQQLFLAENSTATVTLNNLPQNIVPPNANFQVWSFDNNSALWLEEPIEHEFISSGTSTSFTFDIDEFTFWNCGVHFTNTCVSGEFFSDFDYALENRHLQFSFTDDGINYLSTGGNTNNAGTFEAKLPRNKIVTLSIYDRICNDIIFEDEIGPFLSDQSNIEEIETSIADPASVITGSILGCEDLPPENAAVFLQDFQGNIIATTQPDEEGRFSIHEICNQNLFSIKVLDLDNMTTTETSLFEFIDTEFDIGEIITCQVIDSSFITVNASNLELLSFSNPEFSFDGDSLVIIAENNFGWITLSASIQNVNNYTISFIQVSLADQQLICTNEYSHTVCGEALEFTSLNINDNIKKIDGVISGILFTGNIEEEEFTIAEDVIISFSGFY